MSNPLIDHENAQEPIRFSALWRGIVFAQQQLVTLGLQPLKGEIP